MNFQCNECGYQGNPKELKPKCKPSPLNKDKLVFDASCPICGSDKIEFDYIEDFVIIRS